MFLALSATTYGITQFGKHHEPLSLPELNEVLAKRVFGF